MPRAASRVSTNAFHVVSVRSSATSSHSRYPARLRLAAAALHRLAKTVHATLGEAGLLGYASDTLLAVVTKILENQKALVPKSHVGLFSDGLLNSCRNSVPQRT